MNLAAFVRGLVQGRVVNVVPFTGNTVLLDEALCAIILENVLNNATKHGCPGNADVRFHVEQHFMPGAGGLASPKQKLVFKVTNHADPAKPQITNCSAQAMHGSATGASSALFDGFGLHHIAMAAKTGDRC